MCDPRQLSRILRAASDAAAKEKPSSDRDDPEQPSNRDGVWSLPPHLRPMGPVPEVPPEGTY